MVAVEAGKSAPDGGFWNEFPDRISDTLIFAGIGYGIGWPALGWTAVAMALLTAYVRELGQKWSQALAEAHRAMPRPPWMEAPAPAMKVVR